MGDLLQEGLEELGDLGVQQELALQHGTHHEQSVEVRCPRENFAEGFLVEPKG